MTKRNARLGRGWEHRMAMLKYAFVFTDYIVHQRDGMHTCAVPSDEAYEIEL